jgi:hypothetical protein
MLLADRGYDAHVVELKTAAGEALAISIPSRLVISRKAHAAVC